MLANYFINIYSFYIIYRLILPIFYLITLLLDSSPDSALIVAILFNLICLTGACLYTISYASNTKTTIILSKSHASVKYFTLLVTLGVFNTNLPIVSGGGSDALSMLSVTNKYQSWIGFILLELTYLQFIVSAAFTTSRKKTILMLSMAVIIAALSMSKIVVFIVFVKYLTLRLFLGFRTSIVPIAIALSFGVIFAVYVYLVTISNLSVRNINDLWSTVFEIFYYSANFVYILMLERGGIDTQEVYMNLNNEFFGINYFLNPFLATFGLGIQSSIGPFLNESLFGIDGTNGVNPTLFFELFMVYGEVIATLIAPLLSIIILLSSKTLITRSLKKRSEFEVTVILQIAFYLITSLSDSLYAIRSIFPLLVLLVIFNIIKKKNVYVS